MKKDTVKTVETDVLEEVSRIRNTAVKALKKGAVAAKRAAHDVAVTPAKVVNHTVYGVCYGLAYGAVYGALVVGKVFPADGAVSKGLHQGLETAIRDFDAKHQTEIHTIDSHSVNA